MKLRTVFFIFSVLLTLRVNAQVVISEIMYNNPGENDLEFIELYNANNFELDLSGYSLSQSVTFFLDGVIIPANGYIIVAKNSSTFQDIFGISAYQWESGSLDNTSGLIQMLDDFGEIIDEVSYSNNNPWPILANGYGASLERCQTNENDASNWRVSTTDSGKTYGNRPLFSSPGQGSDCSDNAVIALLNVDESILESGTKKTVTLIVNNPGAATTINLSTATQSSADSNDFNLNSTLEIPAQTNGILTFDINISEDNTEEADETIIINLTDPNEQAFFYNSSYKLTIIDNDAAIRSDLILTGVYDAQTLTTYSAKGIEIYAKVDIPDLSKYGVGFADNGNGSQGQEYQFPNVSLTEGQFIYVTFDNTKFKSFFGFDADFVTTEANIDGNDAIELYESGVIIDVFGDATTDGTGTAWEYLDGWAYRKSGTTTEPESLFQINNWNISGTNQLNGAATNSEMSNPFPLKTYSKTVAAIYNAVDDYANAVYNFYVTINVLNNDENANIIENGMTISVEPEHGTAVVNNDFTITYTPDTDYCGEDTFTYKGCEVNGCKEAVVHINIQCPTYYPELLIGTIKQNNENGISIYNDSLCTLTGVVHGVNLNSEGLDFTIIDGNYGINVFSSNEKFNYTVKEGDKITVKGKVGQSKGLTKIYPSEIQKKETDNGLMIPSVVTEINEEKESVLIKLTDVHFVDANQWTGSGNMFTVDVTDGTNTYKIRIDDDVDLFSMNIPTGNNFTIVGIVGQDDDSAPYEDGYYLSPRYVADITAIVGTEQPDFVADLNIFPNPVTDLLNITSKTKFDAIKITDLLGQELIQVQNINESTVIDVSNLNTGIYFIKFQKDNTSWTERIIKK